MLGYLCSLSNKAIAVFLVRWALGLKFLLTGIYKISDMTLYNHANNLFVQRFADSWIPEPVLWFLGYMFPIVELAAGILLCVGWRRREAVTALGGLIVIALYGHMLLEPFFDLANHSQLWLLTMVVFLLVMPKDDDAFTLDGWIAARKAG